MAEVGLKDKTILVGNLDSVRTIADVRDAVRAYHLLLTNNPIKGATYNIGGDHSLTIGEILEFLISHSTTFGLRVEIDSNRMRPIDADLQIPDTNKFKLHTGWKPTIKFEQTLLDLLNYWRDEIRHGRVVMNR
jgi:GDPmannose 4,6-dehydratase